MKYVVYVLFVFNFYILTTFSAELNNCTKFLKKSYSIYQNELGIDLTPIQILPKNYISEIESKFNEKIIIKYKKLTNSDVLKYYGENTDQIGFQIQLRINNRTFVRVNFYYHADNPKVIEVGRLRLENPINQSSNLRLSQKGKGLPFEVTRYIVRKFYDYFKNKGIQKLTARGADNYAVHILHLRLLNLEMEKPIAHKMMFYVDRLYEQISKKFPDDIFSLDQFSRALGSYDKVPEIVERFNLSPKSFIQKIKDKEISIEEEYEEVFINHKLIGIFFKKSKQFLFSNPFSPSQPLTWKYYCDLREEDGVATMYRSVNLQTN